jgi:zinc transport system substrate-binding protein
MFKNKLFLIVIIFILTFGIITSASVYFYQKSSSQNNNSTQSKDNKLNIFVTNYPLEFLVKGVYGDTANITNLTDKVSDPHDYEPSISDITSLQSADLLVYSSKGFDIWVDEIKADFKNSPNLKLIDLNPNVDKLLTHDDNHEAEFEINKEESHVESEFDPHFYLSPKIYLQLSQDLFSNLSTIFTLDSSAIERFNLLQNQITQAESIASVNLLNCLQNEVIVTHNFLNYLSSDYNFEIVSAQGIDNQNEPSIQKVTEISNLIKSNNLKFIYTQEGDNSSTFESIASENKVEMLTINSLEKVSQQDRESKTPYLDIMKKNFENLNKGLECGIN